MKERITVLNQMGYMIVEIINPITSEVEFFQYSTFNPVKALGAQMIEHKHVVKGRNITSFLKRSVDMLHANVSTLDKNVIASNINSLPEQFIEFSEQFLWVNYLPNKF